MREDRVNPSDIYCVLIGIIVCLVLGIAYLCDRLAELRREINEGKDEAAYWKKQAAKTWTEYQNQVWNAKA